MNTKNLHERKAPQPLDSCPLLTAGRYLHHSLRSSLSTRSKPGLRSICYKNVFRTPQQQISPAVQLSPSRNPTQCGFIEDYMKSPMESWGRQLVTFVKTVIRSLKKPDPSAPFHLYAVLQHPVHRAA